MLIIDDISRTGRTLHFLKRYLIALNYKACSKGTDFTDCFRLDRVYFAALLVVLQKDEVDNQFRPDRTYYRTSDRFFKLPWSEFSAKLDEAFAMRRKKMNFDSNVISQYERISSDYDFALQFALQQLPSMEQHIPAHSWRATG